MNPNFINLSLSLFPDDQHQQLIQLSLAHHHNSSSTSQLSLQPNFLNVPLQQTTYNIPKELAIGSLVQSLGPSMELADHHHRSVNNIVENEAPGSGLKISLWKRGSDNKEYGSSTHDDGSPKLWVPSKIRLMGRMVGSNRTASQSDKTVDKTGRSSNSVQTDHNNNNNMTAPPIRVCSDCNTTKTPLWRSGPRGPKSLCNACGIRQRKARKAMAAAAATAVENISVANKAGSKKAVQNKEKRSSSKDAHILPFKKRCTRMVSPSNDNMQQKVVHEEIKNPACFEDFYINLSKNLAYHRVFPQDEKEAAILLMALSCGLVHG